MALPLQPSPTSASSAPASLADADTLRHQQALATQLRATEPLILQRSRTTGVATISHW